MTGLALIIQAARLIPPMIAFKTLGHVHRISSLRSNAAERERVKRDKWIADIESVSYATSSRGLCPVTTNCGKSSKGVSYFLRDLFA